MMEKILGIAGGIGIIAGVVYLLSDKKNFTRSDLNKQLVVDKIPLNGDEREIIYLASLAPNSHNTQPWIVNYIEPYHWIIGNDKTRWLTATDPAQREAILSIGAFMQNLEYAATHFGYSCQWNLLATSRQDESIAEVRLIRQKNNLTFDISKIQLRRTIRSNFLRDPLKKEDLNYLLEQDSGYVYYFPKGTKEYQWLNEQTIEANKSQLNRKDALRELAHWFRFASKDAKEYNDGLTTAAWEMNGTAGWVARNFFNKKTVMGKNFRKKGVEYAEKQVAHSGGWIIITSKGNSVENLLETGKRMERLFLKVRDRRIAIHPMSQVLEEFAESKKINEITGLTDNVHFILRTGYLNDYPEPVSLRRPIESFIYTAKNKSYDNLSQQQKNLHSGWLY